MKKLFSNTAFTLVELIVASLLVAITLMGLFSINMVLSSNNRDYGQRYLVKSATQTTLDHILADAYLAVGDAVCGDEAILIGSANTACGVASGLADANTFCIHQQPGGADQWMCYSWYPSTDANYPYQIRWCVQPYVAGANPRGAAACGAGGNYLGTAFTSPTVTFTTASGQQTGTGQTGQLLFSVTLQNYLDNNASNPGATLTGSTIPPQVSVS